jgi:hypothetical protein
MATLGANGLQIGLVDLKIRTKIVIQITEFHWIEFKISKYSPSQKSEGRESFFSHFSIFPPFTILTTFSTFFPILVKFSILLFPGQS